MRESTGWYIIFGTFGALMAGMMIVKKAEGGSFLTDCKPSQKVEKVEACRSGRGYLECAVTTEHGTFRTDVTNWPGSIIVTGDEIYQCTVATKWRDDIRKAPCKNGLCSY